MCSEPRVPKGYSQAMNSGDGWLISRNYDTLLFLLPNLAGAMLILAATGYFWEQTIFYYCNIFFTLAHFGPTWIRCYMDREGFSEFRRQVIIFPVFFFALTMLSTEGMVIVLFAAYFWDRFHGIMQNVGFLKLYDSKAGMTTPLWNHLDRTYILVLAFMVLAFNMGHLTALVSPFATIGLPIDLTPSGIQIFRKIMVSLALGATLIYAFDLWKQYNIYGRLNYPKLVFLACLAGGHFAMNSTTSFLLLFTHEKIYHSIQYMVLVWKYNNNKIERHPDKDFGKLFHLFSANRYLYLLFIAGWIALFMGLERVIGDAEIFMRVNYCIALSHYYFDSFIWRVRSKNVQENI